MSVAAAAKSDININKIVGVPSILTQFMLDCTSFNLENDTRVHMSDPAALEIYSHARHFINAIHSARLRKLELLKKQAVQHNMI